MTHAVRAALPLLLLVTVLQGSPPPSRGVLYLVFNTPALHSDLAGELLQQLSLQEEDLSMEIAMLDSAMALHPPPADTHSLLLFVEHTDRDDSSHVTVTLFTRAAFARSRAEPVPSRPLATLGYTPDAVGVPLALGKLIGENLRTSHLCHLTIETAPPGARVHSDKGLQGTSPVEWVLPVAPVHITLTLENHLPRAHTIALEQPGRVHYTFELRRRSFVHSRFFPLALGAATLGGAGFALDRLFYTRYRELGEEDYHEQPDAFGRLFKQAQLFERISLGMGVTAGVFLGLSFLF